VRALALALVLAGLAGCTWRAEPPPPLGETVRIVVRSADLRLPQAAAHLEQAVGETVVRDLGWRVTPAGSARLELAFQLERIRSTADDDRGVPIRWEIRLRGTALLIGATGTTGPHAFSGTGSYGGLEDEDRALRSAATDAARDLAEWLEDRGLR
jgi:hypothetical protein